MHQTTVRFGAELWGKLIAAAENDGVSISAYVREATLLRVAVADAAPHRGTGREMCPPPRP
jgi:hypothetical protein